MNISTVVTAVKQIFDRFIKVQVFYIGIIDDVYRKLYKVTIRLTFLKEVQMAEIKKIAWFPASVKNLEDIAEYI